MIKLSVNAMAAYLRTTPEKQRALLRDYKYPSPAMQARLRYYTEARATIAAYHRGDVSLEEVEAKVATLRAEAKGAQEPIKTELTSRAAVIERYLAHQGHRRLELLTSQSWDLVRSDVQVTASPTMFAREHDALRIIFLQFGRSVEKPHLKLVAELAFEVVSPWMRTLPLRAVQAIGVRDAIFVELERRSPSLARDLAVACKAITTQWPDLEAPPWWRAPNKTTSGQLAIELHPKS